MANLNARRGYLLVIQLGRAAGFEIWVTSRGDAGRALAERLGAHRTFATGEVLPRRVDAVIDNIGSATWAHSISSACRGGTIVTVGITSGSEVIQQLLPIFVEQLTITGSIMGTRADMENMMKLIVTSGIEPEIGKVVEMAAAKDAIRDMWEGRTQGKTVFTR